MKKNSLDVWVSSDGKKIIDRYFFTGKEVFDKDRWYDFNGKKYKLDNFYRAHERMSKVINN